MDNQQEITYVPEEGGATEEKTGKLRKALHTCRKEKQEYLEGWQRARADFQNYIKQSEKELDELRISAADDAIRQIFPVLDNLILACDSIPEELHKSPWVKGIVQIRKHIENIFREQGVEEIKVEKGALLDPAYHELTDEVEGEGESGTVVAVVQRGYTLHGKILRPARVRVVK